MYCTMFCNILMCIQCVINVHSMYIQCTFNIHSIYIQCLAMYSLFALVVSDLLSYPKSRDAIASKNFPIEEAINICRKFSCGEL